MIYAFNDLIFNNIETYMSFEFEALILALDYLSNGGGSGKRLLIVKYCRIVALLADRLFVYFVYICW